ncbi:MAG: DPP IV N-terminal domain-containing protein [candidate division WOR-3 bacterium]
MKKIFYIIVIILFTIPLLSQILVPKVFNDMSNTFFTSSEHFNYIYKKELSEDIEKIIKISEGVYDTLKKLMKTEPPNKINLLITDQSDLPNGFSTPILNPTVNIYLANPDPSFISKHENWIEYVLIHELTHTFHLTKTKPKILSKTLNSCLYLPAVAQPMYFLEGYTVYNESTIKSGRLKDTNFEAILRTLYLENKKAPLDRAVSYYDSEYPYGTLPYLYGPYIFEKIKEISGKEIYTISDINLCTCLPIEFLFPDLVFLIKNSYLPSTILDIVYKDVEKKTFEMMKNYDFYLKEKLINDGLEKSNPVFKDNKIYFIESYFNKRQRIILYENGKKIELFKTLYTTKFQITDEFIIYDMIDLYDNISYFFSIYSYNLKTKKIKKLPHTFRGFSPEIFGDTLFFIRNTQNKNLIIFYSLKTESLLDSIEFPENYRLNSLSTKDGKSLLLSIYRDGGFTDIVLFDLENKKEKFLTSDRETDFLPQWSKKYNGFYFISDRDGFNTLFFYDLDSNRIYPYLRSINNISNYSIDEENEKVYFQDITKDGDNIFYAKLKKLEDKKYEIHLKEYKNYIPISKNFDYRIDQKKYILPKFSGPGTYYFLPLFVPLFDDSLSMSDILLLLPFLNINADISQSLSFLTLGIFSYTYDLNSNPSDIQYYNFSQIVFSQFKHDIFVSFDLLNEGSKTGIKKYLPDSYSISAGIFFDRLKFEHSISFSPAFSILKTDSLYSKGLYFDFLYSKTESSRRSIIPSSGYRFISNIFLSKSNISGYDHINDLGLNLKLEFYGSSNWRTTFFAFFETFLTNNYNVNVYNPSSNENLFYKNVKLRYNYLDEGNFVSFASKNLNLVKIGLLNIPLHINRGIPIKLFVSSPIKLSYLTLSLTHTEGYSIDQKERISVSKFNINLISDLFALGTFAPGIFISYDHIYGIPNLGITLSLY